MRLLDFKVRVLSANDGSGGTASVVRVLIESGDADRTWVTVGVSHDIIEASCRLSPIPSFISCTGMRKSSARFALEMDVSCIED